MDKGQDRYIDGWCPTSQPWLVCAAIRKDTHIICGARHWDNVMRVQVEMLNDVQNHWGTAEQGFIDQWGRFYNREEAMQLARQNAQIIVGDNEMLSEVALYSEDLY